MTDNTGYQFRGGSDWVGRGKRPVRRTEEVDRELWNRSRQHEQRMRPTKRSYWVAQRLLRERLDQNRVVASKTAHVRVVERFGDDGYRCPDCVHVELHSWEPERDHDFVNPLHNLDEALSQAVELLKTDLLG